MTMTQDKTRKTGGRYLPQNNFESFDLFSRANFILWSNARYDFELIAELIRYKKRVSMCLELLSTVNNYLTNAPEKVFFDGTIKSLKYLVKNGYLKISDLPTLTYDEKYLIELLEKYLKRLDITEIFSDIEEPTLRAMLLEYPDLLKEVLKSNPMAGRFIGDALLKNGITDIDSFTQKIDDGSQSIEVDPDKNSGEAMKCKIIYLGLHLNSHRLKLTLRSEETINQFSNLTDESVENGTYNRPTFNSIYAAMYGSADWNKEKKAYLTGVETLYLDFQLLNYPNNHMSLIYDIFLKEDTEKIGKKYFGEAYQYEGSTISLAVKMAITIILFRSGSFIPQGEEMDSTVNFGAGAMLEGLNYAIRPSNDNKLELKEWFINYYRTELDKRMAFIKLQLENNIAIAEMRGITRVIYLPVFESFRYFGPSTATTVLGQIIRLFKNKGVSNDIKDDILINFVMNIQKIASSKNPQQEITEEESFFKDTFILLISEIFENLIKKHATSLEKSAKKYYEKEDLLGDAKLATIELILNYDFSKNDSFIGYLTSNLYWKMKTSSRSLKKSENYLNELELEKMQQNSQTKEVEKERFLESIPDEDNFLIQLNNRQNLEKIHQYIEKLPEKQKEAIEAYSEGNRKLSETERKNKNRGLNKIREMMAKA